MTILQAARIDRLTRRIRLADIATGAFLAADGLVVALLMRL